jgi:hypothetical protein
MATGAPLLDRVRESAPAMNQLTREMPRLAAAARPTLRALGPVLVRGAETSRRTLPLSRLMRTYTRESLPNARIAGEMLPTLEQRSVVKNLLAFLYNQTLATARYDELSHILPAHVAVASCMRFATVPDPGCGAPAGPQRKRRRASRPTRRPAAVAPAGDRPQTVPTPEAKRRPPRPADVLPALPELEPLPPLPGEPQIDALLDYLFG